MQCARTRRSHGRRMDDKKWDERAGSDGGREVELRSRPTERTLEAVFLHTRGHRGSVVAYVSPRHARGRRIRETASAQ